MIDLNKLKAPFPVNRISWRVGAMNKDKTKCIGLAYIDARDVMERLDDVCGAGGWQNRHPHANGKTSCSIGIKIGDEWVWKENGAGDSQVEAEKGAFSDSFKRAAVQWGIGRYLYDMPNIWVEVDEYRQIKATEYKKLEAALNKLMTLQIATAAAPDEKNALKSVGKIDWPKDHPITQEEADKLYKEALDVLEVVSTAAELEAWRKQYNERTKLCSNYQYKAISDKFTTIKAGFLNKKMDTEAKQRAN